MDRDTDGRHPDVPIKQDNGEDNPIKDDAWSKVDLHDRKKTPDADVPSDIEPEG